MRKTILAAALACAAVIGCSELGDSKRSSSGSLSQFAYTPEQINSTGKVPPGCVRLEGGDLGKTGTFTFDGVTITFTSWTSKDGKSNGEYVNFSFTATGPVAYAVKAGTGTHYSTATSWTHPAGTSGSSAKGISNITFCPGEPADGGTDPGFNDGHGGAPCTADIECWSNECENNTCQVGGEGAPCVDAERDCGEGACVAGHCDLPDGARGEPCTAHIECWSGECSLGACTGNDVGESCRDDADCSDVLTCVENPAGSPTRVCSSTGPIVN